MKLPLVFYGDPFLRKKAVRIEEINDELKERVANMTETLYAENGIGLAATQVHYDARLFITCMPQLGPDGSQSPGIIKVYINPEIVEVSSETNTASEGCLSIPGLRGDVERPNRVKISATDLDGNRFTEEVEGYEAHCILHENDHLNGVLYIDRIKGKERKEIKKKLEALKKKLRKKGRG